MRPSTQQALDRMLKRLERPRRTNGRCWTSPLMLCLGLILGYQLLVRLVPRAWSVLLPGGLDQARSLRGWPGLVFRLAEICQHDFPVIAVSIAVVTILAALLCRLAPITGWLIWLTAILVITLDAGILVLTLSVALSATARDAGLAL